MVYDFITDRIRAKEKLLALLIDPDKCSGNQLENFTMALKKRPPHLVLVGGSLITNPVEPMVDYLKSHLDTPVVLYPGSPSHLVPNIDALLLLSMISGRNAELLIGHHVVAAPYIKRHNIEAIPTGYMLIDGGSPTSVEYISGTRPIPSDKTDIAAATAMAGEMLGLKLIYMDAGSGALNPVSGKMIKAVKTSIQVPLMVGGGIRSTHILHEAFSAGAQLAVIGNVLEKEPELMNAFLDVAEGKHSMA
jgi:phosphoglycerol geranylgeranyltransferase